MREAVSDHLNEALSHLRQAIELSVQAVSGGLQPQRVISQTWEDFVTRFFAELRRASREHGVNLLSWISFSNLWKR